MPYGGDSMKIFDKHFFLGLGVGIIITIILEIAAFFIFIAVMNWLHPYETRMAARLEPPPLSDHFSETAAAEYDWMVKSLDGTDFPIAEAKGKTVFLNFWATWCLPCRIEMPGIQKLYEHLKEKGIVFICISDEENKIVSAFIRKKKYTFPVYTMKGAPPQIYKTEGIPATFIISPEGKVVLKHVGSAKWDYPTVSEFILGLKSQNTP